MILRYFDTSPLHSQIWPMLAPEFADIAGPYAHQPQADSARQQYLQELLKNYAKSEPLLLVWHVNEADLSGARAYIQLRQQWATWSETARQRVFILFFSGAGGIDSEEFAGLPPEHYFFWPEPVRERPSAALVNFIRALRQALAQKARSGDADWGVEAQTLYAEQALAPAAPDALALPALEHTSWRDPRWQLAMRLKHWRHLPVALRTLLDSAEAATLPADLHAQCQALQAGQWRQQPALLALKTELDTRMTGLLAGTADERALATRIHATLEQDLHGLASDWRSELSAEDAQRPEAQAPQTPENLAALIRALPEFTAAPTAEPPLALKSGRVEILVIENEPLWQEQLSALLQTLATRFGREGQFRFRLADSVQATEALLADSDTRFSAVVTGLGLPEVSGGPDQPGAGLKLIAHLRSYALHLPVIVLTTLTRLIPEQQQLAQLGIQAHDFLLKDNPQALLQGLQMALEQLLSAQKSHHFRINTAQQTIHVDDLPLKLPPQTREIFIALAELCANQDKKNDYFQPAAILKQLAHNKDENRPVPSRPDPEIEQKKQAAQRVQDHFSHISDQRMRFGLISLVLKWNWLRHEEKCPVKNARAGLQNILLQDIVEMLLKNFQAQGASEHKALAQLDELLLLPAALYTSVQNQEEKQNKQVYDAILRIRKALYETFNQAGQQLDPVLDVLPHRSPGGQSTGYRLLGEIQMVSAQQKTRGKRQAAPKPQPTPTHRWRVLALENNPTRRERLQKLFAEQPHYQLELACSVESALRLSEEGPHEALILDLQIPETDAEWQANPDSGSITAGLQVLEQILARSPATPPALVINTRFSQDEHLRQTLIRLKLSPAIVQYCDPDQHWEAQLWLNLERLRKSWLQREHLPRLERWQCPRIEVLNWDPLQVSVNGQTFTCRGNKAQLLRCLLQNPGGIPEDQLLIKIYGSRENHKQALKQLTKNLRKDIQGWFSELPADLTPAEAALWLLERGPGGDYCLHGWVQSQIPVEQSALAQRKGSPLVNRPETA